MKNTSNITEKPTKDNKNDLSTKLPIDTTRMAANTLVPASEIIAPKFINRQTAIEHLMVYTVIEVAEKAVLTFIDISC